MPANPPPSPTLPCEQCGYANEPERVYCHNCGSKLDRSLLPKAGEKAAESPEKARKRIEKITNPKANVLWRETKALFKVAVFSALVAAVLLICQKPDGIPEGKKEPSMRLVSSDMMDALGSPIPKTVQFSDDDINQYLKQQTAKPKDTFVPGVTLDHAYIHCDPGVLHITSEMNAFGLPLYARIDYKLEVKDGKFIPTILGGAFGRLSIDPQAMQYGDYAFGALFAALQREHKQMDKMQSVVVEDGKISLTTKGVAVGR